MSTETGFIAPSVIEDTLAKAHQPEDSELDSILEKARELKGLSIQETAILAQATASQRSRVLDTARFVKEAIYGKRLVLFAPLYVSNICKNDCLYCAFRASNTTIARKRLSQQELQEETRSIIAQGHKRVLLVAGEDPRFDVNALIESLDTIYATKLDRGEIRRVNVNVAALNLEDFKRLAQAQIGTYQLFQETYHLPTFKEAHIRGPKSDYLYHLTAMDRAMEAGIDDVGIGALFGLYDWRFELIALMQHATHLQQRFGVGPHTISVPRIEPASNAPMADTPPHLVSDDDFKLLIACIRLAVPYTGIILSTRETAGVRRDCFQLGVSQISAGSRTNPGGYNDDDAETQFQLGDHRPTDEVIRDIATQGYIPSFCTGCYRLGRVGKDFMDLCMPGEIQHHCYPNAVATFEEYLLDYGSAETCAVGRKLIEEILNEMSPRARAISLKLLEKTRAGRRDVFV